VEFEGSSGEARLTQMAELQAECRAQRNVPLEEGIPAVIRHFFAKYGPPGDDLLLLGVEV
jgi:hypothetical protein